MINTSAVDEKNIRLAYFLTYLKLLIPLITVFYLVNLSIMGSVDWPLNGSRAIFATDNSMLNAMAFYPLIRKSCVVYFKGQSLVPYYF